MTSFRKILTALFLAFGPLLSAGEKIPVCAGLPPVARIVEAVGGDAVTVTIDATPGFYYSIAAGSTLANIAEVTGDRTLATGDTVTLALPKQSTAGFYKVLVNIVQKPTGN